MAEHENGGRREVREKPHPEPELLKMIDETGLASRFALPGALCAPVFEIGERDGLAMRVLMAMIWISSDTLKRGEAARFQAALSDLRHAAGFTRYKSNQPVRDALDVLRGERSLFSDGAEMSVFEEFEVLRAKDLEMVQWTFNPEFARMFDRPARFAVLDIREVSLLTKGIDVFLYRQATMVRKMRRPEFRMPADELYRISEIDPDTAFKRVVERVKRSLSRVVHVSGLEVSVIPIQQRGSRALAGLTFRVGDPSTKVT